MVNRLNIIIKVKGNDFLPVIDLESSNDAKDLLIRDTKSIFFHNQTAYSYVIEFNFLKFGFFWLIHPYEMFYFDFISLVERIELSYKGFKDFIFNKTFLELDLLFYPSLFFTKNCTYLLQMLNSSLVFSKTSSEIESFSDNVLHPSTNIGSNAILDYTQISLSSENIETHDISISIGGRQLNVNSIQEFRDLVNNGYDLSLSIQETIELMHSSIGIRNTPGNNIRINENIDQSIYNSEDILQLEEYNRDTFEENCFSEHFSKLIKIYCQHNQCRLYSINENRVKNIGKRKIFSRIKENISSLTTPLSIKLFNKLEVLEDFYFQENKVIRKSIYFTDSTSKKRVFNF